MMIIIIEIYLLEVLALFKCLLQPLYSESMTAKIHNTLRGEQVIHTTTIVL